MRACVCCMRYGLRNCGDREAGQLASAPPPRAGAARRRPRPIPQPRARELSSAGRRGAAGKWRAKPSCGFSTLFWTCFFGSNQLVPVPPEAPRGVNLRFSVIRTRSLLQSRNGLPAAAFKGWPMASGSTGAERSCHENSGDVRSRCNFNPRVSSLGHVVAATVDTTASTCTTAGSAAGPSRA